MRKLDPQKPIVLVVDEVPELIERFLDYPLFSCVVVPSGKAFQNQRSKYPKFKWVFDDDADLVADEIKGEVKRLTSKEGFSRIHKIQESNVPWLIHYYMDAEVYSYGRS
jgi:hypothetical protein